MGYKKVDCLGQSNQNGSVVEERCQKGRKRLKITTSITENDLKILSLHDRTISTGDGAI